MAGKFHKDLRLSPKIPRSKKNQLETSANLLEDEIKRLQKEVTQVRTDLKIERARAIDLTFALQEKEEELQQHQTIYDQQIKDIIAKLTLLEAAFQREKQEITELLGAKDSAIELLSNEVSSKNSLIESLRKKVESSSGTSSDRAGDKCKLEKKTEAQKHEIDKLRNANARLLESLSQVRLGHSNSHHKGKQRRSSTPVRSNGNNQLSNSELSEWKEELSAFF